MVATVRGQGFFSALLVVAQVADNEGFPHRFGIALVPFTDPLLYLLMAPSCRAQEVYGNEQEPLSAVSEAFEPVLHAGRKELLRNRLFDVFIIVFLCYLLLDVFKLSLPLHAVVKCLHK